MTQYLGQEMDDDRLTHLVDAYVDAYGLAGGENMPGVEAILEDMSKRSVTSAQGAAYAGKERARLESEESDNMPFPGA